MTGRWTSGKRRAGGKGVCALSDEPSNGSERLSFSSLSLSSASDGKRPTAIILP